MPHLSLSHTSLSTSEDKNGFRQSLSIDSRVLRKSPKCSTHRCRVRSTNDCDPRNGAIVLAKFSDRESSGQWAKDQADKARTAQDMAVKFNHSVCHMNQVRSDNKRSMGTEKSDNNNDEDDDDNDDDRGIEFLVPQTCQLDDVSVWDRKRKENETFIVMDEMESFQKFLCCTEEDESSTDNKKTNKLFKKSKSHQQSRYFSSAENIARGDSGRLRLVGKRSRSRSESEARSIQGQGRGGLDTSVVQDPKCCSSLNYCDDCGRWNKPGRRYVSHLRHGLLHAFVHHFFNMSGGQMAIDCLKGRHDPRGGYTLSVPAIYSLDGGFGAGDRGVQGMAAVIDNHVCSDLCRHLPQMTLNLTSNSINDACSRGEIHPCTKGRCPIIPHHPLIQHGVRQVTTVHGPAIWHHPALEQKEVFDNNNNNNNNNISTECNASYGQCASHGDLNHTNKQHTTTNIPTTHATHAIYNSPASWRQFS